MRSFWLVILDMFNFDKGFPHTMVLLTKKPGEAITSYLFENRHVLVPPFRLVIFTAAIATFLTLKITQPFSGEAMDEHKKEAQTSANTVQKDSTNDIKIGLSPRNSARQSSNKFQEKFYNDYFNLLMLLGVPLIALGTFWLFRSNWYYAEHLVANCYVYGYTTVLYIITLPVTLLGNYWLTSIPYTVLSLLYTTYAYKKIFAQPSWAKTFIKTLVVFLISIIGFVLASFVIAIYFIITQGVS